MKDYFLIKGTNLALSMMLMSKASQVSVQDHTAHCTLVFRPVILFSVIIPYLCHVELKPHHRCLMADRCSDRRSCAHSHPHVLSPFCQVRCHRAHSHVKKHGTVGCFQCGPYFGDKK